MKYMGSKRRIAKHIIPIMVAEADQRGIINWIEPFVGGANLIDKVPARFNRVGYDFNDHLIFALKDIRDIPDDLPENITDEYYRSLIGTVPASITSYIRFVCSFGGKFEAGLAREKPDSKSAIERGHVRNFALEGKRNAEKQSPLIQGVDFIHADYRDLSFKDSLIYCDPPYQNTSGYKTGDFDSEEFFEWCRAQAKDNIVFVSEYSAPFKEVWSGEIKTNFSSSRKAATHKAVEKLFLVE